jgi:hypothetical protein
MSGMLKEANIIAMIDALSQFCSTVTKSLEELHTAGRDCAANLGEDRAGAMANASLVQKIGNIEEAVGKARRIINLLYEELEDIRNRARIIEDL